jgi:hypothetical protein
MIIYRVRMLERRRQRIVSLDAMHGEEGWPDMTEGHVFNSGYRVNIMPHGYFHIFLAQFKA